ncbi:lipase 3-like [Cydia pomonella]|uniref:lipase 3-like n=1 Tax=Cydia pomonella TaxID=82600 RepID=UPI002ADDE2C8|nr:lipase 3-like [Cydia pomonella]
MALSVHSPYDMRKLFIIVIILLNQNQQVSCGSIFEVIFDKLIGIKHSIVTTIEMVRKNIQTAFVRTFSLNPPAEKPRRLRDVSSSFIQPARLFEKMSKYETPDLKNVFCGAAHSYTTPQLSASDGRIMETHVAYTLDGYILTLHRLHSSQTHSKREKRTILLHHGLLGSSADWILLGPKKSLPYILSDAGHDVWLANSRGNYYSRTHVSMKCNSEKYWNFSWQEIGEYDLPATLDYIRKTKNSTEPIDYIGHSMGATALLVLLSEKRNYNSYLRIAILLAPLARMTNTGGSLHMLATMEKTELVRILGTREFMPSRRTSPLLSMKICHRFDEFCNNPLFFLSGTPLQNGIRSIQFKNKLQEYVPAGGSTKTVQHYLELINNREFHHYGKPDRKFELKFINTPILLISSNDDSISNVTDNRILYLSLANPVGHIIIEGKNLSHSELAWGSNADILFYYKIKDMIDVGLNINEIF